MIGNYTVEQAIEAMLEDVRRRRMDESRDAMIQELRDERADQGGGFDGEIYLSYEHAECPAREYTIRVIERGSLRLRMLPRCSFCSRELHYAGLHAK